MENSRTRAVLNTIIGILCAIIAFMLCFGGYAVYQAMTSPEVPTTQATRSVKVFQPASIPATPASDPVATDSAVSSVDEATVFGDGWYRAHLSDADKGIYDAISTGFRAMQKTIEIPHCDVDTAYRCYQYVLCDDPSIYWVGNSYEYMMYPASGEVISISPMYRMSMADRDDLDAAISECAGRAMEATAGAADDYERARGLYEWVAGELSYDEGAADEQVLGLVCRDKVTACAGYSKLYQYLCRQAGLDCIYLTGQAKTEEGEVLHAWNGVTIDGEPVYVDVTWGDRDGKKGISVDYSWLALTSAHIDPSHTPDNPEVALRATDGSNEVWTRYGTDYARYDEATVISRLGESVGAGWDGIVLFFEDDAEADRAYESLATSTMFPTEIYKAYPDRFPVAFTEGVYSLRRGVGLNAITVSWKYEANRTPEEADGAEDVEAQA